MEYFNFEEHCERLWNMMVLLTEDGHLDPRPIPFDNKGKLHFCSENYESEAVRCLEYMMSGFEVYAKQGHDERAAEIVLPDDVHTFNKKGDSA
jgi:hypothetical protein